MLSNQDNAQIPPRWLFAFWNPVCVLLPVLLTVADGLPSINLLMRPSFRVVWVRPLPFDEKRALNSGWSHLKMWSLKDMPPEAKSRESRRGRRMNSRVPVALEWEGEPGTLLREEGHTRVVNCYGCLAVTHCNLPLEKRVRLTNLATRNSIVAVVVWRGKERTEGWELGLELVDPEMDFWGLEL